MERRGQGAIEYLLIIGAAILVVAIVIIAVTGVLGTTQDRGEQASIDQNKAQNMQRCIVDCNVLGRCRTGGLLNPNSCAAINPTACEPISSTAIESWCKSK